MREPDCGAIEPLLAPYGEPDCGAVLTEAERTLVAAHLEQCPACRDSAHACSAARAAVRAHAAALADCAPPALRARCRAAAGRGTPPRRATRWLGWTAAAATAAALLFVVLMPAQAIATQLTVDHVTCTKAGAGRAFTGTPDEVERAWHARRAEHLAIPAGTADGLRLTGLRRCLSTRGGVAHVMYERSGAPVSLFILSGAGEVGAVSAARELEAVGHKAILWSSGPHTYILIGRGADLGVTATHMQKEIAERTDSR